MVGGVDLKAPFGGFLCYWLVTCLHDHTADVRTTLHQASCRWGSRDWGVGVKMVNFLLFNRDVKFPEGGVGEVAMFEHRMDLLGYS